MSEREKRLEEIERKDYRHETRCTCGIDVPWLLDEIRSLEQKLETAKNALTICAKYCSPSATRALEEIEK